MRYLEKLFIKNTFFDTLLLNKGIIIKSKISLKKINSNSKTIFIFGKTMLIKLFYFKENIDLLF